MKIAPFALLALTLLLAACASDAPPPVKLGYDLPPRLNLDVLTVGIQDRSNALGAAPQSVDDFRPTVATSIRQYINERLIAVGTTGEAVVTIKDAGVRLENMPYNSSLFTRPQAARYVGHAEVEIKLTGREGYGQVTGQASRFETLLQDPTPAERQNAYNAVLNGLMHDLAANLDTAIHDHLAKFVMTAPPADAPVTPLPLAAPYTYPSR